MKLFWECADFQVWECCKNSQIKKKNRAVWRLVVLWQTLFNVWAYHGRCYLTSIRAQQKSNCSIFLAPFSAKIDICCFWPRRWITSDPYCPDVKWPLLCFLTLFWRHPVRRQCLGRRQRSKISAVKRLFCVSVIMP